MPLMATVLMFLISINISVRGEATLELELYDLAEDPLLACNDGTPGGFYYRPATSPQYESRWIFYLEVSFIDTDIVEIWRYSQV